MRWEEVSSLYLHQGKIRMLRLLPCPAIVCSCSMAILHLMAQVDWLSVSKYVYSSMSGHSKCEMRGSGTPPPLSYTFLCSHVAM